ncbi:hypothetical protein Tco_0595966 [Tanacetum coccineum]
MYSRKSRLLQMGVIMELHNRDAAALKHEETVVEEEDEEIIEEQQGQWEIWRVMLYLTRRSFEVLRKFHWMILGG